VDECSKEGKVDCAGYLRAVLQVDRGKLGDELLHGATWGKQHRLCCHVRELEGLETWKAVLKVSSFISSRHASG
jgi:hypothetical protein